MDNSASTGLDGSVVNLKEPGERSAGVVLLVSLACDRLSYRVLEKYTPSRLTGDFYSLILSLHVFQGKQIEIAVKKTPFPESMTAQSNELVASYHFPSDYQPRNLPGSD